MARLGSAEEPKAEVKGMTSCLHGETPHAELGLDNTTHGLGNPTKISHVYTLLACTSHSSWKSPMQARPTKMGPALTRFPGLQM